MHHTNSPDFIFDIIYHFFKNANRSTCFPSLPKLCKSAGCISGAVNQFTKTLQIGESAARKGSPLYSSILQRSPICCGNSGEVKDTKECLTPLPSLLTMQVKSKPKLSVSPTPEPVRTPSPPPSTLPGSFDCGFCRSNEEPESVYRSHPLRLNDVVVCPNLRKYVCCICGATGDIAHTVKYCPKNPVGFFAKKAKRCSGGKHTDKTCSKGSDKKKEKAVQNLKIHEEEDFDQDHESRSDSESVVTLEEKFTLASIMSGTWIEAKPKGRKKKSGKCKNAECS